MGIDADMYAAFSKGFGKGGNDLLKKDFKDRFEHKLTTKAKAADGTTFEANVSDQKTTDGKYESADFAVTIPVDDGFKVTVKTEANSDNSVKVDYTVDANFNANATFTNPSTNKETVPGTVEVGANYATKEFPAEVEARIFKESTSTEAAGFALGLAAPVPMVDGLSVGARPTYSVAGGKSNLNLNAAYDQKDYGVSVNTLWSNWGDKFDFNGVEVIAQAKVNADCSVAAAWRKFDNSAPSFPAKLFDKVGKAKKEFAVATQYKLSKSQTCKAKFTFPDMGSTPKTSLALKTALEGKSSLTMSMDLFGTAAQPASEWRITWSRCLYSGRL